LLFFIISLNSYWFCFETWNLGAGRIFFCVDFMLFRLERERERVREREIGLYVER
jgi:hypothetical protein